MKLSLKSARRLEKNVGEVISNIMHNQNGASYELSIYDNVDVLRDVASDKYKVIQDLVRMTEIRYCLRREIGRANNDSNLNDLIVEEASLKAMESIFMNVVRLSGNPAYAPMDDKSFDKIQARLESAKKRADTVDYMADAIDVRNVFDQDMVNNLINLSNTNKARIMAIQDECSRINATATIEVDDMNVEFLRSYNVVIPTEVTAG